MKSRRACDHWLNLWRGSLMVTWLMVGIGSVVSCSQAPAAGEIPIPHYERFEAVLDSLGFSMENWRAGIRDIPRAYVTNIPERWGAVGSREVTVARKKRIFYRALLPLILRANEIIASDRNQVLVLREKMASKSSLSAEERQWLARVASRYEITQENPPEIDPTSLLELVRRVDVVPASLALAQAAYESGYGTSRFAGLGNALYGQWAWGQGLKPEGQRAEHGDHRIAAFETPLKATLSYMHNLNTHRAYAQFRKRRAGMRDRNQDLDGYALADALDKYSERGHEYVETLRSIMKVNKLEQADEAYLRDMEVIYLIPAGGEDGSD